ncbi:MAG: flippase [Balneolaceae bacterium]
MNSDVGKSIARNFSVMMGAQVVTWVSSFILLYFLPRYLGSEDFGRLYLALSIMMMLSLLIDFGGSYLIPKEVARSEKKGSGILSSYIILRILLWVLSIGIVLLLSDILGYSEHVSLLILILAIGKLWEGGSAALNAYFQGIERMEYPSAGKIVERIFVALFAVIALLLGADSIAVAAVMTVGALMNMIVIVWLSRNFVSISWKFDFKVFSLLSSGMPYFLFSLFSVVYYRIDAIMISAITNETVTGWYGGAYRFFDIVMILPLLYKRAIFPIFSRLWDNKDGSLENTVGESLRLMIILGIPTSILIYMLSGSIINFFMGLEEYGPSVIILQIFAVSVPIIYVDIILGSALLGAANRQRAWAIVGFVAIIVNVLINYLLIPFTDVAYANGGIGAAIATLATELFVMSSAFYLIPGGYLQTFRSSYLLKPAGAGLLMAAGVLLMLEIDLHWLVIVVMGSIVYVAGLFLVKTFNKEELEMMKNLLSLNQIKLILYGKNTS